MLKISQPQPVNHTVILRLEGRVVGPWVAELRAACERFTGNGTTLVLELDDVTFLDRSGVALLQQLRAHVLIRVGQLDLLGDGHAIMRHGRRAELLIQRHIAALGSERGLDGIRQRWIHFATGMASSSRTIR